VISRSTPWRLRLASVGVLLGMIATLGFGAGAAAAAPSPTPSPAKPASTATTSISGPTLKHALTFRQDKQPAQYAQLLTEVSWMDGRSGDIIRAAPTNLGPHFVVTTTVGSKVTGRYDLYPEVSGGPRAHRQGVGSVKEAWFYAPVDMASTLASIGVAMPTSAPTAELFVKPTVAATSLKHSLSTIARESVTALALAALGCVAILILLAFAARRSHSVDRRHTLPPAIGRLASVKAKAATGRGAVLRGATPPGGAIRGGGPGSGAPRGANPRGAGVPGGGRRPGGPPAIPAGPLAPGAAPVAAPRASGSVRMPVAGAPSHPATAGGPSRQFTAGAPARLNPQTGIAAAKRVAEARRAAEVDPTAPRRTTWRSLLPNLTALPRPRKATAGSDDTTTDPTRIAPANQPSSDHTTTASASASTSVEPTAKPLAAPALAAAAVATPAPSSEAPSSEAPVLAAPSPVPPAASLGSPSASAAPSSSAAPSASAAASPPPHTATTTPGSPPD
jgi:hypothetical protein